MNMKQDISKNLQKFLHSHLQFSSIFRNYLPETKVFSSSVPQKNPQYGPFHLFSEQVPVCGIIGIGLFQRKSRKCRKFVWKKQFQKLKTRQVGWPMQTGIIVSQKYLLAAKSLGIRFLNSYSNEHGEAVDSCTATSSAKSCLGCTVSHQENQVVLVYF